MFAFTVIRRAFALLALALLLASCTPSHNRPLVLPSPQPIDDFTLTDQDGEPFRFSSLRGKPVLVSFLFTNCDDVCSYLAIKVQDAQTRLGDLAGKAAFVVISTDPEGDSVAAAKAYTEALGMSGRWHYLTGTREELEAVWRRFGVAVAKTSPEQAQESHEASHQIGQALAASDGHQLPTEGLSKAQQDLAAQIISRFAGAEYEISHTAPYWLVDREGKKLSVLGPQVTPQGLADALKPLIEATP